LSRRAEGCVDGRAPSGLLFDFQRLRQTKDIRTAPLLAASIFLDVLNVFLLFLSIFGGDD
jgi:FtsH-binding integral membrane protein